MITPEEVRFELRDDTLTDSIIDKAIERAKAYLVNDTNNPDLFSNDDAGLDFVLLFVVCSNLNPDVRGRQGVASESIGGVSYTYLNGLPDDLKRNLNKYRRANWL